MGLSFKGRMAALQAAHEGSIPSRSTCGLVGSGQVKAPGESPGPSAVIGSGSDGKALGSDPRNTEFDSLVPDVSSMP